MAEKHVSVSLFEVETRMREVESAKIAVWLIFAPFLWIEFDDNFLIFLKLYGIESQHIFENNFLLHNFLIILILSFDIHFDSFINKKHRFLSEIDDKLELSRFCCYFISTFFILLKLDIFSEDNIELPIYFSETE